MNRESDARYRIVERDDRARRTSPHQCLAWLLYYAVTISLASRAHRRT